jgi:hypothetical protein
MGIDFVGYLVMQKVYSFLKRILPGSTTAKLPGQSHPDSIIPAMNDAI